jgi:Tol biopolymer transport system component
MSHVSWLTRLGRAVFVVPLVVGLGLVSAPQASAATAKDTGRLAFVRANQIYTSTVSGTGVKKLTSVDKNFQPQWSPDGRRIAYIHMFADGRHDIWVMNADGSHKTRVTWFRGVTEPTWSPDGKWIAFGGGRGLGSRSLYKVRSTIPHGRPILMLGNVADGNGDPLVIDTLAWSPDGTKIAYYSDSFPDSPDHYMLEYTIATKHIRELGLVGGSCCGEGYFGDPAWTPNSQGLAMTVLQYFPPAPEPPGPHIELANGKNTQLYDVDPEYSPTGAKIVFANRGRIIRADADGTHRSIVTTGYQPDWQPVLG